MMPGARLQAAIELLGQIHGGSSPADRTSAAYFRSRRYIGGTDRREILDLTYSVLRRRAALDWRIEQVPGEDHIPDNERARIIAKLVLIDHWTPDKIAGAFDGGRYRPQPLDRAEKHLAKGLQGQELIDWKSPPWVRLEYPRWFEDRLKKTFGPELEHEMAQQIGEAATDLRVNALKGTRQDAIKALAAEGVEAQATPLSPYGLRLEGRTPLASLKCFMNGLIEVQDEGSQLVGLLCDAKPGMRVVDFCAGAGGKTLAIAAQMRNKGKIVACDVLEGRIERAAVRFKRAGAHNIERRPLSSERDPWVKRHAGAFDRVLVDAPCSGAGTWRRNPDAKWRLTPEGLIELIDLQKRILESAARLVKPGGRLIYATCSLIAEENQDQVNAFLKANPDFTLLPIAGVWREAVGETPCPATGDTLSLTPARNHTDGFFVAVMERKPVA